MKRDVVWSDDARIDMNTLIEHIAKDSIQNATLVVDRIEHSIDLLTEMQFGRVGRVFDTYEAVVPKAPFIVVYRRVEPNRLAIVRVIHTSRDWPPGDWPADDQT